MKDCANYDEESESKLVFIGTFKGGKNQEDWMKTLNCRYLSDINFLVNHSLLLK